MAARDHVKRPATMSMVLPACRPTQQVGVEGVGWQKVEEGGMSSSRHLPVRRVG